ncbi:hypothetical protein [uncultured Marinobacter sp.]|uniref:hypothetical protein n=1 Tax=uncultured Marinobacter sp. TaxID=187379 RepID=UPI0030DB906D
MSELEPTFLLFIMLSVGILILGLLYFPLWAALHKYLTPRLDGLLFREPWFQKSELDNYRLFPLSLLRSLNYIYLIGWPRMAKKKRFKGFDSAIPVGKTVVLLCRAQMFMAFFGLGLAIVYFGYGGIMAVFVL